MPMKASISSSISGCEVKPNIIVKPDCNSLKNVFSIIFNKKIKSSAFRKLMVISPTPGYIKAFKYAKIEQKFINWALKRSVIWGLER